MEHFGAEHVEVVPGGEAVYVEALYVGNIQTGKNVCIIHEFVNRFQPHGVVLPGNVFHHGCFVGRGELPVDIVVSVSGEQVAQVDAQAADGLVYEGQVEVGGVVAHVMAHIIAVRLEGGGGDAVLVGHGQGPGKFGNEAEVFHRPAAEAGSSLIAQEVVLVAFGDPRYRELIHEEGKEQVQVFDVAGADVEEHLRVLPRIIVGGVEGMVNGLVKEEGHQVGGLHADVGIDDRITEGEVQVFEGDEGEHVGGDVFVVHHLPVGVSVVVRAVAVDHVRHQPAVYIVEFKPPGRGELQPDLPEGRVVPRQNIGPVVVVSPHGMVFQQPEGAPVPRYHQPAACFAIVDAALHTAFSRGPVPLVQVTGPCQGLVFVVIGQTGVGAEILADIPESFRTPVTVKGLPIGVDEVFKPVERPERKANEAVAVGYGNRVEGGGQVLLLVEDVERFHAGGVVNRFQAVVLHVKLNLRSLPPAQLLLLRQGLLKLFGNEGPRIWLYNGVDGDELLIGKLIQQIINVCPANGFVNDLSAGRNANQ